MVKVLALGSDQTSMNVFLKSDGLAFLTGTKPSSDFSRRHKQSAVSNVVTTLSPAETFSNISGL